MFCYIDWSFEEGFEHEQNQSHDQLISIFRSFIHYIIAIINDDYLWVDCLCLNSREDQTPGVDQSNWYRQGTVSYCHCYTLSTRLDMLYHHSGFPVKLVLAYIAHHSYTPCNRQAGQNVLCCVSRKDNMRGYFVVFHKQANKPRWVGSNYVSNKLCAFHVEILIYDKSLSLWLATSSNVESISTEVLRSASIRSQKILSKNSVPPSYLRLFLVSPLAIASWYLFATSFALFIVSMTLEPNPYWAENANWK